MNQLARHGFVISIICSSIIGHALAQADSQADSQANNYTTDNLHGTFDQLLAQYVSHGKVDYAGIKRDQRFSAYLDRLKQTNPDSFGTDVERLVFWINAYNALAIKGILAGLSPYSWLGRIKFFRTTEYEVGGRLLSLNDLEHDIIIPFGEPRIHFAIVCASRSCPPLRPGAYLAGQLTRQLEEDTRHFVNDTDKNRFHPDTSRAEVSKIFDWYKADFKKHAGSVQRFMMDYMDDPLVAGELVHENFRISYLKYDWSLNGTAPE